MRQASAGTARSADRGLVYLLCFSQPVAHARHYLGVARADGDVGVVILTAAKRISLLVALHAAGGTFTITKTWSLAADGLPLTLTQAQAVKARLRRRANRLRLCPRCAGSSKVKQDEDTRSHYR